MFILLGAMCRLDSLGFYDFFSEKELHLSDFVLKANLKILMTTRSIYSNEGLVNKHGVWENKSPLHPVKANSVTNARDICSAPNSTPEEILPHQMSWRSFQIWFGKRQNTHSELKTRLIDLALKQSKLSNYLKATLTSRTCIPRWSSWRSTYERYLGSNLIGGLYSGGRKSGVPPSICN